MAIGWNIIHHRIAKTGFGVSYQFGVPGRCRWSYELVRWSCCSYRVECNPPQDNKYRNWELNSSNRDTVGRHTN